MTIRHLHLALLKLHVYGVAGLVVVISPAQASPIDPTEPPPSEVHDSAALTLADRERQLMETGYGFRQQGKDADALKVYRDAYELRHDAKPLAQMALALEALGDWSQAYSLLQKALGDQAHPWIAANRALLENELSRMLTKVGRLTLVIEPEGAKVRINGSPVGTAPLIEPLLLNPGWSTIDVEFDGYTPYRYEFEAEPAKQYREVIRLTRREPLQAPTYRRDVAVSGASYLSHPTPSRRNSLWLGTAAGGAIVAAAALIPWSIASQKVDDLGNSCISDHNCPFDQTRVDIQRLDRATNVLLFSGLGIAASSIVVYFCLPETVPDTKAAVSAFATRDGAVFSLGGHY